MTHLRLVELGGWVGWIAGHWIAVVTGVLIVGFIYLFSALMLDLPLPFEKKKK